MARQKRVAPIKQGTNKAMKDFAKLVKLIELDSAVSDTSTIIAMPRARLP